jgi:hypothetical protein
MTPLRLFPQVLYLLLLALILSSGLCASGGMTPQAAGPPNSASHRIDWQVVSEGGQKATSTHYICDQTVGQTAADSSRSPSYVLHHGFWQKRPLRGDANGDDAIDISDAVFLIAYIFSGGPAPSPLWRGDANCDGVIDISDAVYLIAYIFSGGPAPCFLR